MREHGTAQEGQERRRDRGRHRRDNQYFFDLGGHSILAAQLTAQLRKIFGVEIPAHNVFRAPTVAEFATMLEALLWSNRQSEATATSADRVEIDL